MQIGDEARCVADLLGFEKSLDRSKSESAVAQRAHEPFHRLAHGIIVINDGNIWNCFVQRRTHRFPSYRREHSGLSATDAWRRPLPVMRNVIYITYGLTMSK